MDILSKKERLLSNVSILKKIPVRCCTIFFRDRELHSLLDWSRYVNPFVATCQAYDTLVAFQYPCTRVTHISILFEMHFVEWYRLVERNTQGT